MSRVCYIFGAGASANAVPIVDEFNKWIGLVGHAISRNISSVSNDNRMQGLINEFSGSLIGLEELSKRHRTIDNYLRLLYIRGEFDEISKVKRSLSIFFTIWQSIDPNELNKLVDKDKQIQKNWERIDPRYLSLLIRLQHPSYGKIQLGDRVNFITWNYDSQLELALKFLNKESNWSKVCLENKVYPFYTSEDWKIIHLNGIAGLFNSEEKNTEIIEQVTLLNCLQQKNTLINNETNLDQINKNFKYAWEIKHKEDKHVKRAKELIGNSSILVFVGYSFPEYNTTVDRELLGDILAANQFKAVYLQNPNSTKTLFCEKFSVRDPSKIFEIQSTSDFYIPVDLI